MKKIITSILLALLPIIVNAAYDMEIKGIYYNFSKDGVSVSGCTQEKSSVTIPSSVTHNGITYYVTSISRTAFYGNSVLKKVTIPNSVTSIGESAFKDCSSLTSVTIGNNVTSIGESAFYNCSSLTSITIPNSVTSIGYSAFSQCKGLTSITIPNGVTSIGDAVFWGCVKLTSVNIPNSVTSFGKDVFAYCPLNYNKYDNAYYIGNNENPYVVLIKPIQRDIHTCKINESCKIIYGSNWYDSSFPGPAFYNCRALTSIEIPNSVISIGVGAFSECRNLTSVSIPNSVNSIGNKVLVQCPSLQYNEYNNACYLGNNENPYLVLIKPTNKDITTCEINTKCKFIYQQAFGSCNGLTSVTIPNSVTSIGDGAFDNCSSLTKVIVPDIAAWCSISYGDYTMNPLFYAHHLFSDESTEITNLVIPNGVTSIGNSAFYGCTGLTSVTFPNSITSIGNSAFYGCTGLTSVTFPNSIISIGHSAFYGCTGLTSVTIPDALIDIGGNAFKNTQIFDQYYVNRGTDGLLAVWNYGINPYEIGSSQLLSRPSVKTISKTQATITYQVNNSVYPELEFGCNGNGESLGNDLYLMKGLKPGNKYQISLFARSANNFYSTSTTPTTLSLSPMISNEGVTASSVSLKGSYTEGDANVISHSVVIDESEMEWDEGTLHGLDPNTSHNCKYIVVVKCEDGSTYSYEASKNIKTAELTLTTLQPKVISDGNVILAAQSNLDDEETNVGFEWRRNDWTDDFDSKSGGAYLFEGMMEGYIRSVNSNYLWKFRPFYTSNAGNTYYGEWKGMDPSDYSYFEPTVHTYADINVTGNSAEVKGYAMRGTDNVTSQGFMYWENNSSFSLRRKVTTIPDNVTVVRASGNVMTATLEDLEYETSYSYVAFMTTSEGETFYGEVNTFTTDVDPDGVDEVKSQDAVTEIARYDVQGRPISKPQKGINIIRYSDGSTRKVMVK